jgi:hypothetical protein
MILRLHHVQNNAELVLRNAGFSEQEISEFSRNMPIHINEPALPNLLYIVHELSVDEDARLDDLIREIENFN